MSKKPTVLLILDGYGLNDKKEGNAVALANTPVMDKLMAECPFVKGQASGMAVGLPEGQMGNSEVGHLNMGAGRIVYQELTRITKEIEDGTFFENEELVKAMENAKKNNSALHIFGLLSDGGVHSHITHMYGTLEMAKKFGLEKVYVHAFLDGRDTPPASAAEYMQQMVDKMAEIGVGEVATISGRYYAMDRDNNWDREEKAYVAMTKGEGVEETDPVQAIKNSYEKDVTDEFVLPTVIKKDGQPVATIKDGDSVVFCNFRPDRARFAELPEVGDGVGHVRQQVVQQGLGVLARIHAPFLRQARVHLFQNDIQPLDIRPLWGQAIISHTALPPL